MEERMYAGTAQATLGANAARPSSPLEEITARLQHIRGRVGDALSDVRDTNDRLGLSHIPQEARDKPSGVERDGLLPVLHTTVDELAAIVVTLNEEVQRLRQLA